MFVGEDNYKFVKIQICYGEYLWLLAVEHKKKEQRETLLEGKDSAGGEMPVIADGDGEQAREVWVLSAGNEVPTAVA